jgi:hypothetical protein
MVACLCLLWESEGTIESQQMAMLTPVLKDLATGASGLFRRFMTEAQRKLLQAVIRDGLKIPPWFLAAPVYASTGHGYLKSEGVETLQKIKRNLRKRGEKGVG